MAGSVRFVFNSMVDYMGRAEGAHLEAVNERLDRLGSYLREEVDDQRNSRLEDWRAPMTTTKHQTEIVADPDVPQVRITREFDAPVERVFRAHTDPGLFSRWNGPRETVMEIDSFDCRTGGSYRYTITSRGVKAGFRGCFHEVRLDELIVQTFTFEGMPDGVALERLTFEDLDSRTRLTATALVDSFEDRDAFLASGMEVGVREGYEQLDELLADEETPAGG